MRYLGIIAFLAFLLIFIYVIYSIYSSSNKSTSNPTYSPSPTNKPTYPPPPPPETEKDCIYTDWQNVGECTASCGGGLQGQKRFGTTPHDDPTLCLNTSRSIPCNTQSCAPSITPTSQKGINRISSSAIPRLDRHRILFSSAGVRNIYPLLV